MSTRARAAAAAAALLALVLLVGTAAYLGVREEPEPPPTTTTTTTTSTTVPLAVFAEAIAEQLEDGLEVPITRDEARCVATALLGVLTPEELERLASLPSPFAALDQPTRDRLVRGLVGCVPPETAASLLGGAGGSPPPVDLPDEG
jgi:hypothetical protein